MYQSNRAPDARPVRRKLRGVVAAFTMFGATVGGFGALASPAYAANTTTPVHVGDVGASGSPWALEPTGNTGTYAFVSGPATPPDGTGSLALGITSGQHEWMNNYAYGLCGTGPSCNNPAPTPIANIDALGLSTYRASGTTYPTINVEVNSTGTSGYTTLVFVPTSASVTNNTWQSWDGLNSLDGSWYSTHQLAAGVFACPSQSAGCTASWAQIQASYSNAKIAFGIGANVGTGGTFTGNVDDLVIGVSGNTTTYDFEPDPACTTTCYVNGATGNDANAGSLNQPLQTIQAGVNKVSSGGTVQVAAGTYTENVTIAKALTLAGAGQAGTKIVPAFSDPNCGGAGGATLCPGSSNVVLVQASGVTVHDLTVDGDNQGLTSAVNVGGANIDARNGIVTDHSIVPGAFASLSVHDVTVKNIYLRGIFVSTVNTFSLTNNTVDNVQANDSSIAMFNSTGGGTMSGNHVSNTNDALSANNSRGTQFTNNTITAAQSGIHTDNSGNGGGTADVISGNTVSACLPVPSMVNPLGSIGFWTFAPYLSPTISNNTVSGCDVGLAALGSCDFVAGNICPGAVVPTTTFSGNTVTGASGTKGLVVSTDPLGQGDGDVKASADHNVITSNGDGVTVQETSTAHATLVANRNAITGNTNSAVTNTGATNVDATCNWWGQSSGPAGGQIVGPVTVAPWLIASNLNSNCLPVVKIGNAAISVTEGNSGNTPVMLPVTLDRPSSQTVTVFFNTQNGTAGVGDYHGNFGTITFAPGETAKSITVNVIGDTAVEPDETFNVKLSNPTNSFLANANEGVIIRNDDKPTMSVANLSVAEGSPAVFTVTLSQPYFQAVVVNVSSANGSAHANGDYNALLAGRHITIPAGSTTGTISVVTNLDGVNEPAETFTTTYSSSSVTNGPVTATATIQANNT